MSNKISSAQEIHLLTPKNVESNEETALISLTSSTHSSPEDSKMNILTQRNSAAERKHPPVDTSYNGGTTSIIPRKQSLYAYVFIVGGIDPKKPFYRNHIYGVLMAAYLLRQKGSTSDMHAIFQLSYSSSREELFPEEVGWLNALHIAIHYIPKYEEESFYTINLEKFRILNFTQYRRVAYMDADVMPMINLDYLMELSDRGVLKENIVVAGRDEPSNGGFFVLMPFVGAFDRVQQIMRGNVKRTANLSPPYWDTRIGWGHQIEASRDYWTNRERQVNFTNWNFCAAFADQGLLYHWTKYERKSVSIVFPDGLIENWGPESQGADNVFLQELLNATHAFKDYPEVGSVCRAKLCFGPVYDDYLHFVGPGNKPWQIPPPENITSMDEPPLRGDPRVFWYWTLQQVSHKLNFTLDLKAWDHKRKPLLGAWTDSDQIRKSLRASKARTN